jgi:endonuclease/exonuclease/phosphatase family metal-dependent hydrolase
MRRFFRFAGWGLYAVLAVFFLAGYAARYVPPRFFWWAELIAVGLPYLAALLVVATLFVFLRRRSWTLRIVHLVLLALIAWRFVGSEWWKGRAGDEAGGALTVMTYNLPRWTGPAPPAQRDSLRRMVGRIQPELVALQEARLDFQTSSDTTRIAGRPYVTALVEPGGYRVVGPGADAPTHTMQPVFGKVPLAKQSKIVLRRGKQDATYVTRTRFRWQGRPAVYYNLHLRSFGERKPWHDADARPLSSRTWRSYARQYRKALLDRAWEARRIQQMLNDEDLPFIVSGDFNSTPHGWAYWHLADDLTDAFRVAGDGWGGTYHSRFPFARIDFVLASAEWRVLGARVPDAHLSDHRPLVAQLAWKE